MPEVPEKTFLSSKVSNVFDGADPFALFKVALPPQVLLGAGVLLAAAVLCVLPALPPPALLVLAAALILPSAARAALHALSVVPDPERTDVRTGHFTDAIDGEFCVFILGARCNSSWKLRRSFAFVGQSFKKMIEELECMPQSAGYLGGESFVSSNPRRGSHGMAVTYWRSYEHMLQYTHDAAKEHSSVMRQLAGKMPSMPEIGIWHETYLVTPGQHESVYINCPPLGLGAAAGLKPVEGPLVSSRGRVRVSGLP